jgi:predicted transcriptional regulator
MKSLKKLLIKKLVKENKQKKKQGGLKFDQKNSIRMKSKKIYISQTKKIVIKRIRTKVERLKNHRGEIKNHL